MLKLLNTSVAKLVGATSAVVFQHICYWMQTQDRDVIYRTNQQLSDDLDGIYSVQQIQRAKKKLIDEGLIVVTADKRDAWNRTSHYSLTQKGEDLLLSVNKKEKKPVEAKKESTNVRNSSEAKSSKFERNTLAEQTPQTQNNSVSSVCKSNNALEHNTAMKESFKEGFSNANAVPMPDNLKSLFKRKKEESVETEISVKEETQTACDKQEWEDVVKAEMDMLSDDEQYTDNDCPLTDDDYNECEIAMLHSIETTNHSDTKQQNLPSMTFAELMKTAYNKATTEAQEQMYRMKQEYQQYKYCEDY